MSKQASPVSIGVFVAGALLLAAFAVVTFGGSELFRERLQYVVYFDERVTGLDRGAPVKFRGVRVGLVRSVEAVYDAETSEVHVPVYIEFVERSVQDADEREGLADDYNAVERLIQRGMRAHLSSLSLVTGQLYVSLDLEPDTEAIFRAPPSQPLPEIPTRPSPADQVSRTIAQAVETIDRVPLDLMGAELADALGAGTELLTDPGLKLAVEESGPTVVAVGDLARTGERSIGALGGSAVGASEQATRTLQRIDGLVKTLNRDLGGGSPLQYQVMSTLQDISETAQSVRTLSDTIGRQPDAFVVGRKTSSDP